MDVDEGVDEDEVAVAVAEISIILTLTLCKKSSILIPLLQPEHSRHVRLMHGVKVG